MKTIINRNLKELSVEELKKKENGTKYFMFIVFFFGFIYFRGYWYYAMIFLALIGSELNEIQKELKSRENN